MSNVRFLLQHSVLIYLELNIKIKMKGRLICSSVYLCRYDEKQSNSRFHIYYVHTVEPTSAVASYNMFKSTTLIRLQNIYTYIILAYLIFHDAVMGAQLIKILIANIVLSNKTELVCVIINCKVRHALI